MQYLFWQETLGGWVRVLLYLLHMHDKTKRWVGFRDDWFICNWHTT